MVNLDMHPDHATTDPPAGIQCDTHTRARAPDRAAATHAKLSGEPTEEPAARKSREGRDGGHDARLEQPAAPKAKREALGAPRADRSRKPAAQEA